MLLQFSESTLWSIASLQVSVIMLIMIRKLCQNQKSFGKSMQVENACTGTHTVHTRWSIKWHANFRSYYSCIWRCWTYINHYQHMWELDFSGKYNPEVSYSCTCSQLRRRLVKVLQNSYTWVLLKSLLVMYHGHPADCGPEWHSKYKPITAQTGIPF